MRTLTALLVLPALLGSFWQDPADEPKQDPVTRDIYGRPVRPSPETAKLLESIQGCWQLVDIEDAVFPPEGRLHAGYLLIGDGFLSIEIHIAWDDPQGEMVDDDFQSGIHEYRLDPPGILTTSSLIGSFLEEYENGDLDLEWEDPGTVRRFQVELAGNFLTLERADGSRLSFSRRPVRRPAERDLYGRERAPLPPSADDGDDADGDDGDGR